MKKTILLSEDITKGNIKFRNEKGDELTSIEFIVEKNDTIHYRQNHIENKMKTKNIKHNGCEENKTKIQRQKLVDALLKTVMEKEDYRNVIVEELNGDIKNFIERINVSYLDVHRIVKRCCSVSGGICELIKNVHCFEGNSRAMKEVLEIAKEFFGYKMPSEQEDSETISKKPDAFD